MTSSTGGDPLAALIIQIASSAEQLSSLDAREAAHHHALTAQLADALGRLDQQMAALTRGIQELASDDHAAEGYQPGQQPRWWHLTGPERDRALSQLRAWVDQIYRPGYSHLAAALPACWEHHPHCVYTLDWLSELWNTLYLAPSRTPAILAAQAEWQTRLLPAAAAQMSREAAACRHARQDHRHPLRPGPPSLGGPTHPDH
jgi:hypothetical protein